MFKIESNQFDFYGLTFTDRTTYRFYKEFKQFIGGANSVHTMKFRVGIDNACMDKLERQFRLEGFKTENTKDIPSRQYDNELNKEVSVVYLTVGNSNTIGQF